MHNEYAILKIRTVIDFNKPQWPTAVSKRRLKYVRKNERKEDIIYLRGTKVSEKRYKRHLNKMRKLVGPTVDKSKHMYIRRIKLFNKTKYTTLSWKQ